ncbi:MAG: hypothetical protein A2171_01730 [Candidatus Levybacteria bacterium RBG_13_35_9]|nr:MAG: hypothetical protein A2171_01730 [Candidatus Levybacteria bacterium RBG_13_35_9]
MSAKVEMNILNVNPDTGAPNAISFNPSSLSSDALRIILTNQTHVTWPLEVHYYRIGEYPNFGVYKTIDAIEFVRIRKRSEKRKERFIEGAITMLKDLSTTEIIFAEPLVPKEK